MRNIALLFLVFSCAHHQTTEPGPDWVNAIRNGDEQLKITNGPKTFYRRIAGGPDLSRQTSCELVIHKAEEDIRKEFPQLSQIPYTVEVLFYDEIKKDCAVTLSLDSKDHHPEKSNSDTSLLERLNELKTKEILSDIEVAEILNLRTEVASRYALTGLSLPEFEKYTSEKVSVINAEGLCAKTFRSYDFSIHGSVEVCWMNNHVKGYCTPKSQQCWIRTP